MIVALLVMIVLILLLGAGTVLSALGGILGFIATVLGLFLAYYLLSGHVTWQIVSVTLAVIIVVAGGFLLWTNAALAPRARLPQDPALLPVRHDVYAPSSRDTLSTASEINAVDRVWSWFADEIAVRFAPEAQETARGLFTAGDALGLDRFCRAEIDRLGAP